MKCMLHWLWENFWSFRLDQTNDNTIKRRSRLQRQETELEPIQSTGRCCWNLRWFIHCLYNWPGLRQICLLSTLLYSIYDVAMVGEATDYLQIIISVGGRIINTIRYADNKTYRQKRSQQLMDNLNVTREFGMKINVKKRRWCA